MDEQEDRSGRWSWLQIGGLLSGVAALITAIATMIATLDSMWDGSDGSNGGGDIVKSPGNGGSNTPEIREPSEGQRLSAGETAVGLWPDGECPYRVTVAESLGGSYRVVFEFGEEKSLPANAVFPMAAEPIEVGDRVFATAEELKGRWIPGTVTEVKEGKFHVVRDGQDTCASSQNHVWSKIEEIAIRR